MTMKMIFPFTTPELPPLEQIGGKALSLMTMTQAGMPVPPGFVLAVDFFAPWLAALQATAAWNTAQTATADGLGEATRALQAACCALTFDQEQQKALESALAAFQVAYGSTFYAVRSSSPEEDLDSASFAGGYETTLGVTAQTLEAAIRHSFASTFAERVFVYKKEHGLATRQPRIAVIVQQQIDADTAGVAFSLNPLNNCYDEAVINANDGLGESVVAGAVEPDVFVVDKLTRAILDTKVGGKEVVIRLNRAGGTMQTMRPRAAQPCLTPAQVTELSDMVNRVEAYDRHPVDIEWAFAQGKLYLLQVRPITTYLPLPEEMRTAPGAPKRLYANSTLIEQGMQEPLSVLGTDFLGYVLNKVGGPVAEGVIGPEGVTFTAGGGYYMNISYALMMGMRGAALAPGSFGDPRVTAILDSLDLRQYLDGELPAALKARRGKMLFKMLPMVKAALEAYLRPEHTLARYQSALPEENRRLERLSGAGLSLRAQAIALTDRLEFFYGDYGIPMILAGQLAQQRLRRLFKQKDDQTRDHLIALGVALPGNKTTEMGELMYTLASLSDIKRYDNAADFLAALERGALSPEFMRHWSRFMDEFGARCPAEIDPATPRPREQPARLFEQLKGMSLAAGETLFEKAYAKRETAYHALHDLALRKGQRKARTLARYYKTWVTLGGYRETPKHYVIKVVDLFRRRALAVAQTFVAEGRLDHPEQIFALTLADIDQARTDLTFDLRALARERTALLDKIRKSRLVARIIDSRGKIYYPPRQAAADGELSGVPISPGVVQGRVKVLHNAAEKQLHPGEILVARATDPGWTPLFINAKGIILEIGGALQHGAVVAREYGIPCVSGVDDVTSLLQDGQWVEVDGSNGIVRIVEDVG